MNPEQISHATTEKFSLREVRLKYLRGEITWETYRIYERELSVQFGDKPRQPLPSPKSS